LGKIALIRLRIVRPNSARITGYSEVEQRTITGAMNWLSRRCDRG